jgi:hypothetical protein
MSHAWGPTLLPSGKLGVSGASPVVEDELRGKRFPSGRRGGWEVNSAVQYALRLSTRVHLPQHIGKQMKLRCARVRDGLNVQLTKRCSGILAAAAQGAACSFQAAGAPMRCCCEVAWSGWGGGGVVKLYCCGGCWLGSGCG